MVVEVTDEAGDSPLEVDVVFPQRIIRVDEQGLRGEWIQAGHLSASSHGGGKVLWSRANAMEGAFIR